LLSLVVGGLFIFGLSMVQFAFVSQDIAATQTGRLVNLPEIDRTAAFAVLALCAICVWICVNLVMRPNARTLVTRLAGKNAAFNPQSTVHTTAIVLSLTLVCTTLGQWVLGGGIEGLAQDFERDSSFLISAFLQQLFWLFGAFLGIGLLIRRTPRDSARRLGLRFPTSDDLFAGFGVGLLMVIFVVGLSFIWVITTSIESVESQQSASRQIAEALDTLPLALIVSFFVATGEEIFFRGALQPVFGTVLTSIFFAILHIQYTLTPASLAVLVLSFALGWLRRRHSTTAAIVAHFIYNFTQLALSIVLASFTGGSA
jgi:hypothetical protein